MKTYRFKLTHLLGLILPVGMVLLGSELALGQGPARGPNPNTGVTIQLPSLGVFGVNTVVSVPDGGTASLGGNSRYSAGRTSRGVPGLGSIPFVSRPFRNQGIGYDSSTSRATVKTQIIILDEMESQVMKEAERRNAMRRSSDPNGSAAVQHKADFLSRHMGRSANRRR